jgi:hypothetical protein
VSGLAFLSPAACAQGVPLESPLAGLLPSGGPILDVSSLGKLELRGDIGELEPEPGEELIAITPGRALLVTRNVAASRERAAAAGIHSYDLTAALVAFEVAGERLLRRLTALDLERLPAVGAILRETPAAIQRLDRDRFRVFVPQQLARSVAEAVLDLAEART